MSPWYLFQDYTLADTKFNEWLNQWLGLETPLGCNWKCLLIVSGRCTEAPGGHAQPPCSSEGLWACLEVSSVNQRCLLDVAWRPSEMVGRWQWWQHDPQPIADDLWGRKNWERDFFIVLDFKQKRETLKSIQVFSQLYTSLTVSLLQLHFFMWNVAN